MDPQQARSVKSRQRLLDAARQQIEGAGIDALTLSGVAGNAGVAVGTVYNRFRDKRHLIEEVIREWTKEVSASFADRRRDGVSGGVEGSFKTLVALFYENGPFIRQIIIHAPLDPAIAASVDPWLAAEKEHLIDDVLSSSAVDDRRARFISTLMLSTLERAVVSRAGESEWAELRDELPKVAAHLMTDISRSVR